MQLTLETEEARLLVRYLGQQLEHMDDELIHTDKRELQRELVSEMKVLRALTDRIASSVAQRKDAAPDLV